MIDLAHLADDVLLTAVKRLTGTANELTAQLLAHLAEVEARGIHRNMACASLQTYCVYELRMSEDEAQRRCRAARLCRQFPLLFAMLADASIHLTGILLLGPHLTDENHREVLARARYRSKRETEKLVAELAPRNDVPARIEPLRAAARPSADHATMMAALCGPVRNLPPGNGRGQAPVGALAELELADESSLPSPAALPEAEPAPSRPMHYSVQFTADQEYISLLEEARDLLAHVNQRATSSKSSAVRSKSSWPSSENASTPTAPARRRNPLRQPQTRASPLCSSIPEWHSAPVAPARPSFASSGSAIEAAAPMSTRAASVAGRPLCSSTTMSTPRRSAGQRRSTTSRYAAGPTMRWRRRRTLAGR